MRKLIWGCAASGVLAVCGAFAATHHAVHHPQSLVGRLMHGASHVASCANPYHGFAPILARLQVVSSVNKDEVAVEVDGLPEDPKPEAPVGGPIEAPGESPPIVIPEGKPVTTPGLPPELAELPVSKELTAPATMPPVGDGEESELPMPTEEVEPLSWWQTVTGWFRGRQGCETSDTAVENWGVEAIEEQGPKKGVGECREDRDYHHHYPGCPFTGRPHCPRGERPVTMPPTPLKGGEVDVDDLQKRLGGSEEPSEERANSSALKAIRKLRNRVNVSEERAPVAPGVDTMEYRLSDQPLWDYGPRPM